MEVNIHDKYLVRPYNALCYEVFEWREAATITRGRHAGKESVAGWRSLNRYPSDMERALRFVGSLLERDSEEQADVMEAADSIRGIYETLAEAVTKAGEQA